MEKHGNDQSHWRTYPYKNNILNVGHSLRDEYLRLNDKRYCCREDEEKVLIELSKSAKGVE